MMRDVSSVNWATNMKVGKVEPDIDTGAVLAGAQFCDAYSIAVDDAALDARHAAERMLGRSPRWIEALLALRHSGDAIRLENVLAERDRARQRHRAISDPERDAGSPRCRL